VQDALVIMARAYRELGITELADDAVRVLRINYPDSPELARLENRSVSAAGPVDHEPFWKFW
ncbi:MAG: outer membrane protein assembly factor BamD, partial [Gammaproteobacteria bacterium]